MTVSKAHVCQCPHCQQETDHPDKELHRQMNLFLSRLDEQQRRWYVALESKKMGRQGDRLLSQITGMDDTSSLTFLPLPKFFPRLVILVKDENWRF
jgi:hypothetical protein